VTPQDKLRAWRENPISFFVDELHITPDRWQSKAIAKFPSQDQTEKRIALKACAGPGKTMVLAGCALNFLACYGEPLEHPKGAAISVTGDNLKTNLWPEFAQLMNRSEFLRRAFRWTKERIYAVDHPETWFIEARSFSKDADPEEQGRTLSGIHAKRVLFLIDESGDIPVTVLKTAEQALANCVWGKIMQAGNPTSQSGMLYAADTRLRNQWHVITITGDPDDADRSPRIDIEWAREQIKTYGRDDPWVMAYILGQYPPSGINALLSIQEVEAAIHRLYRVEELAGSQKRLGIDVARGGMAKTSLFPRWGKQSYRPVNMSHARGNDVAARAAVARERWGWELCFVDDTGGYGGSVEDSFVQAGIDHVPVNFAGKAIDPRYFNKRSEMLFNMATWVKNGGALPDMPSLRQEMPALRYGFQKGQFKVIEKEQIEKEIGHSPDDTDALALTFALPEMPGRDPVLAVLGGGTTRGMRSEFDPFSEVRKPEPDPIEKFMAGVL
jgi:hypothetical protein